MSLVFTVCDRVLKTITELSSSQGIAKQLAYQNYCGLNNLENQEAKFCYDTNSMTSEIFRMMSMKADDKRICKKIKKVNPNFCTGSKVTKPVEPNAHLNERHKRGIIYI